MPYKIKKSKFYYVDIWVPDRDSPEAIHINKSTRTRDYTEAQEIEDSWRADAEEAFFKRIGSVVSLDGLCLSDALATVFQNVWQYNATGERSKRQVEIIIEMVGDISLMDLSGAPGAVMVDTIKQRLLGFGKYATPEKKWGRVIGPDTVDRYMAALKKVLNYHRTERMMADLVVPPIKAIGQKRQRNRELFDHEERSLFKRMRKDDPDFCDLFQFLLDTGLRISEALALSYLNGSIKLKGDAHITANTLKRKNHPPRDVYLTTRAKAILISRQAAHPVHPFECAGTRAAQIFRRYRKAMGIEDVDFVPHMLRHTCTTRLLQAGYALPKVQAMLGHSDERMTLYYNRTQRTGQKGAAEILDKINAATYGDDRPIIDPKDLEIQRLKAENVRLQRIAEAQNLQPPTDTSQNHHTVVQNLATDSGRVINL